MTIWRRTLILNRIYSLMAIRLSVLRYVTLLFILGVAIPVFGYSLLTHEQIIDLTWDDSIVPLLLSHYPNLTPEQLEEARAYAYGGCVIQDIGYYPFGQSSFSNLTHYVRTGDFIVNLLRNAQNADELAFAVGALSHYIGDSIGHPLATNRGVSAEFPDLRARYGSSVNYAEGRHQHVQVEFGYDIDEMAHDRVAPLQYLRHIGMQVSIRQLSQAYYQTYGISARFTGRRGHRINQGAYRFAVRSFIPRIAYAITLLHRRREPVDPNTPEAIALRKEVTEMEAANHWEKYRHRPGIGTHMLAGLIWILPKVGPLQLAAVKGPTEQTEAEYQHSLALATAGMRRMLWRFTPPDQRRHPTVSDLVVEHPTFELASSHQALSVSELHMDPKHPLPNRDLDTGAVVKPGGYPLTDRTYAELLHTLTRQPNLPIPPGIKEDIEAYYANLGVPFYTKKDPRQWEQVEKDLAVLKTMPTSAAPELYPTYEQGTDASE